MLFYFYSENEFIFRAHHLSLRKIKEIPIKIGCNYYEYMSHTIKGGDMHDIVEVNLKLLDYIPKESYEVDMHYDY